MKYNYYPVIRPLAITKAEKFIFSKSKANLILAFLFSLLGFTDIFGQVANYTFSESAGTYTTITGTTAITSGWDDTVTTNSIPIGFTFNFNGTNYTNCSINSNGYITFGATTSANTLYTPISNNTGYNGAISALGIDLIDNNTRDIIYTTTGTAPNRVFTVQWRQTVRIARGGRFDFQIKLTETSNIINVVYGTCAPTGNNAQAINVQVGLRGSSNTDFNNRSFSANAVWDNSTTAGLANNATCKTRDVSFPNSGRTFTWTPPTPPTITSLGAASGCVGSSLVINGTNLLSTTAVTIGGTAATITGTTAITATVTVGAGTTGTVQVTTPGGTATSAATFTVNPLPANPGNPTSNSPQCNPPGVTLTMTGIPPAGVTWYWQGTNAAGTSTANSAATFVATTSGTYYLRAQNNTTGCWSTGSGSLAVVITPTLSAIAGTPAPANAATGICYAGGTPLTDLTWNAVVGADSYDVYFGAGSLPGTAIANVATNSYSLGTLSASTTYYWQVVPRSACGATTGTPATWTFTTTAAPCVCVPTATTDDVTGITNVTFNTINNTTTGAAAYTNTGISTTVTGTNTYPLSVSVNTAGNFTVFVKAWIDWNNNGILSDPGEEYNLGSATNGNPILSNLCPLNIVIPNITGSFKMRVRATYNTAPTPCNNQNYSEAEDYTIVVTAPPACISPAAPTALILSAGTPAGTAINGSFTAAAPAPNSYLVVVSTSNVAPTIANGTTYTIGGNAGVGYTVVDTDTNTTFTAGGLNPSTTYYFYVYSMNNLCSGGPLYNPTPLTGNLTTGATLPSYCNATTLTGQATRFIDDISFLGMLNGNILNLNTGFTTLPAPGGYQDWTGLATKPRQAQGGGVNISFESNSRGTWKAWVDWNKNGLFTDPGELVYTSAGVAMITNTFGFIIPNGATPGDYRVRIRTYNAYGNYNATGAACDDPAYEYTGDGANHFDSCTQFSSYTQFINNGCGGATVNFTEYGETEDYLFTVVEMCLANIVTVNDGEICGPGAVNVSVTGTAGTTQYRWYSAETGGALLASTGTGSWTTPVIAATTSYWVTAFNGSCESLVRTEVIAKISPLPTITFTPSVPEVCGENNIVSITAGGDTELIYLIDEKFEGSGLGVFSNNHITSTAYNTQTAWQKKTSTYIPNGSSWYPAISSNFGANHFAIVTSDIGTNGITIHNALVSPSVSTNTFLDLTLTFRMYFSRYYPDAGPTHNPTLEYMQVEVSDNGGAWTSISGGNIVTDQGYGTDFKEFSYDMSAYINSPNIRVRIRYYSQDWYDGAAVDDIQLFGTRPLSTSFQWTSVLPVDAYLDAAALTTPYTAGTPAVTVYIRPTMAQLEQTTYSFTATAVLNNGCSASSLVSIDNKSKVWKGGTDGDWNNANNWSPIGVPDATTCVIIPPAPNTSNVIGTNYNGFGKTLQVIDGGSLTVNPSNTLTITDQVEVRDATCIFNIENTGSLIQVNNVPNIGNITYRRTANIRRQDYVYWSAPVAGFANNAVSPGTNLGFQYKWLPTTGGFNNFGNWTLSNETMVLGKGYCLRAPDAYSLSAFTNYTASFFGVPNNGNITIPISRGSYDGANYPTGVSTTPGTRFDDNWNLVGNPYPSAIDALDFLTLNPNIDGFVNIWTHGTLPSNVIPDPFYNNYAYNYTPADYLTFNAVGPSTGPGSGTFNGKIAAGQGFFISMLHTSLATTENLIFDNTLRSNTYVNNQFYKTSNSGNSKETEKHRIWFDLVGSNGTSVRSLLGYVENATNEKDRLFDAFSNEKLSFNIFSIVKNENMLIQGRQLPFDANDKVNIGVTIPENGLYKIALSSVDGLFLDANQNIYLEDKLLNVIYNLKDAPYSFMSNKGTVKDRFVLRFAKETATNITEVTNQLTVYDNTVLNVESGKLKIKNIQIFDILGKELFTKNNVNNTNYQINSLNRTNSVLIVKVTLEDNSEEVRKVIY